MGAVPLQLPNKIPKHQNTHWVMKMMSLFISLICCAFWMNNLRTRKQLHCSFSLKTKTTIRFCWLNTHNQLQVQQTEHCLFLQLQPKSDSILWTQELIMLKKKSILVKQIPRSSGMQLHRCKQNKRGWPLLSVLADRHGSVTRQEANADEFDRPNNEKIIKIQPPGIKSCDLNICESDAQLVVHIPNASQLVAS